MDVESTTNLAKKLAADFRGSAAKFAKKGRRWSFASFSRTRRSRSVRDRERHRPGLSGKGLVVGIHQLDADLVRARPHSRQIDRVDVTRIRPPPADVIHMYVQMPDA